MDCKDLIVLICEILYLFVKGPSSIVNKFSNQIENCLIESQVHTLIQNKMLSNFSFQAVYKSSCLIRYDSCSGLILLDNGCYIDFNYKDDAHRSK